MDLTRTRLLSLRLERTGLLLIGEAAGQQAAPRRRKSQQPVQAQPALPAPVPAPNPGAIGRFVSGFKGQDSGRGTVAHHIGQFVSPHQRALRGMEKSTELTRAQLRHHQAQQQARAAGIQPPGPSLSSRAAGALGRIAAKGGKLALKGAKVAGKGALAAGYHGAKLLGRVPSAVRSLSRQFRRNPPSPRFAHAPQALPAPATQTPPALPAPAPAQAPAPAPAPAPAMPQTPAATRFHQLSPDQRHALAKSSTHHYAAAVSGGKTHDEALPMLHQAAASLGINLHPDDAKQLHKFTAAAYERARSAAQAAPIAAQKPAAIPSFGGGGSGKPDEKGRVGRPAEGGKCGPGEHSVNRKDVKKPDSHKGKICYPSKATGTKPGPKPQASQAAAAPETSAPAAQDPTAQPTAASSPAPATAGKRKISAGDRLAQKIKVAEKQFKRAKGTSIEGKYADQLAALKAKLKPAAKSSPAVSHTPPTPSAPATAAPALSGEKRRLKDLSPEEHSAAASRALHAVGMGHSPEQLGASLGGKGLDLHPDDISELHKAASKAAQESLFASASGKPSLCG